MKRQKHINSEDTQKKFRLKTELNFRELFKKTEGQPVSKQQLDNLISSGSLSPGATYKITGVQPDLYNDGTGSGTTIYLKAVTNNTLSTTGEGEFYNPKYDRDAVADFGIWDNKVSFSTASIVGVFDVDELITANNGATGKLYTFIEVKLFIPISGDWSTATSITGDVSGATANISNVLLIAYAIGSHVIWGGYSWTNLTGQIGDFDSEFLLDETNWSKDTYDEVNYNKVINKIEYDIENDWIVTRHDIEEGNIVSSPFRVLEYGIDVGLFPIAAFQFGNGYNPVEYSGVWNNTVLSSYAEVVNFRASNFSYNHFSEYTYIKNCHWSSSRSYWEETSLDDFSWIENYRQVEAYVYSIRGHNVRLTDTTFAGGTSGMGGFTGSIYISNSNFYKIRLERCNSTGFGNKIELGLSNPLKNKLMRYITFEGASVLSGDLQSATALFIDIGKVVYRRPDGVTKVRYYDNLDEIFITDITT